MKHAKDMNEFVPWLNAARPGDMCVYHEGFLAMAVDGRRKLKSGGEEFLTETEKANVRALAKRVRQAYDDGLVSLYQKRVGYCEYIYVAERV